MKGGVNAKVGRSPDAWSINSLHFNSISDYEEH